MFADNSTVTDRQTQSAIASASTTTLMVRLLLTLTGAWLLLVNLDLITWVCIRVRLNDAITLV